MARRLLRDCAQAHHRSHARGGAQVSVAFDFVAHRLVIESSDGAEWSMPLEAMSVADFYREYQEGLGRFGIHPTIYPRPVEIVTAVPFAEERQHDHYDPQMAHACWRILLRTERVLKTWRGSFVGKQSPVHFFWGSFDLASTRFSGRTAPRHPGGAPNCPDRVMVKAYSHKCASCGFWAGDGESAAPVFYAYAYPEPPGYDEQKVHPAGAHYDAQAREYLLAYETLRTLTEPDAALLDFFSTTYTAAATQGRCNRLELER